MSRTYTDTPEPRYVERAKYADNGGGGGDLPEPTIADAGKVLGVNDQGKYALVEGGGGTNFLKNAVKLDLDSIPTGTTVEDVSEIITTGIGEIYPFHDEDENYDRIIFVDNLDDYNVFKAQQDKGHIEFLNLDALYTYDYSETITESTTTPNRQLYCNTGFEPTLSGVCYWGQYTIIILPISYASNFSYSQDFLA